MHKTLYLVLVGALGCDPKADDTGATCAADEVYVTETCIRCGDAGGCEETGAECRPTCTDTAFDCQDGVRVRACD